MFLVVIIIAFLLRFYQLSSLPPALDWDEASTAYNAYSILKTGADEYGKHLLFLFRAYDGYVPPALVYLNVPSVAIFGLSEFGARFPNALLGGLTVVGFYLLLLELTRRRNLAALGALFLTISPWHVTYSRVDFFATLPIFFVVFATFFLLRGLKINKFLILSCLFFVLAILSYYSAYVFVPLFVIGVTFIYRKELGFKRALMFLAPIFLITIFVLFLSPGGQARLKGVSAFSDPDLIKSSAQMAKEDGVIGQLLYNRRFVYAEKFWEGYFASFRFDFLFGKADQVTRMVVPGAGFGLMFWWDLPFLLAGLYFLISRKPNGWQVILIWLVLSPIAAAPTLPQMTSTRTTLMVPALVSLSAYGFYFLIKNKNNLTKSLIIGLLAFNFLIFTNGYFRHFAKEKSADWFFGYRELFSYLETSRSPVYFFYRQPESLDQVYAFSLFYNKVDPYAWQANGGSRLGCGATTGQFAFARYHFIPYACLSNRLDLNAFGLDDLVVTARDLGAMPVKRVYYQDGKTAFFVYRYGDVSRLVKELLLYPLL